MPLVTSSHSKVLPATAFPLARAFTTLQMGGRTLLLLGDVDLDSGEVVLDPPGDVDFVSGDVRDPGDVVLESGEVVFDPEEAILELGD